MASIAQLEAELVEWETIRRVVIRQFARGDKATRAMERTHANACVRCTEIRLKLERARKRAR